jgi:hypothetical protein
VLSCYILASCFSVIIPFQYTIVDNIGECVCYNNTLLLAVLAIGNY